MLKAQGPRAIRPIALAQSQKYQVQHSRTRPRASSPCARVLQQHWPARCLPTDDRCDPSRMRGVKCPLTDDCSPRLVGERLGPLAYGCEPRLVGLLEGLGGG